MIATQRFLKLLTLRWFAAIFSLGLAAATVQGEDRFYMILYSAQGEPNLPRRSHTFATYIKVGEAGGDSTESSFESHTISWLPANGPVDALRLLPQPGKNFDLAETFSWARAQGAQVSAWGPFEVKKELYDQSQRQCKQLDERRLRYVVLDGRFRGRGASNCLHAVSDVCGNQPLLKTGTSYGHAGSLLVLRHLQAYLVNAEKVHPSLIDRLELAKEEIRWQTPTVVGNGPSAPPTPIAAPPPRLRQGLFLAGR